MKFSPCGMNVPEVGEMFRVGPYIGKCVAVTPMYVEMELWEVIKIGETL
ncbi:MAG: hypothetical protein R3Y58_02080 [Eubacteriales bacterium]